MQSEIKYIELKSGFSDDGPAWIGLVQYSKSGRTIYFNGKAFQTLGGTGIGANYFDVESGDNYWISGVKKNQQDRHWAGNGKIFIEKRILKDYKNLVGVETLDPKKFELVSVIEDAPIERIRKLENEPHTEEGLSPREMSFKQTNELSIEELKLVIEYLFERETEVKFNKARRSIKRSRLQFEEELEKRNRL